MENETPETESSRRSPAAGKGHYLAPETRSTWKIGTVLSTAGLTLALLPRAGRTRRVAAGCLGTAGVVALTFALLETAADPLTVRRRLRPYRDFITMFLHW